MKNASTTEYLKINMADAIFDLMEVKSLDKITIADIVSTAGVGRTTWFRSFATKRDAIVFRLSRIFRARFASVGAAGEPTLTEADGKLLRLLFARGLDRTVYDSLLGALTPEPTSGEQRPVAGRKAGAAFGAIAEWTRVEPPLPLSALIAALRDIY